MADKKKASAGGSARLKEKGQPHPLQTVMNVLMDPLGALKQAAQAGGQLSGQMQAGAAPQVGGPDSWKGVKDPKQARAEGRTASRRSKNVADAGWMQRELQTAWNTPTSRAESFGSFYQYPTASGTEIRTPPKPVPLGDDYQLEANPGWRGELPSNSSYGLGSTLRGDVGTDAQSNNGGTPYDVGSPFLPLDQRSPQQVQNRKWAQEQGDLPPKGKPTQPMPRDQKASPPLGDPSLYQKTNSYSAPDTSSILLQKMQHYDQARAQGATHEQAMGSAASAPYGGGR